MSRNRQADISRPARQRAQAMKLAEWQEEQRQEREAGPVAGDEQEREPERPTGE